MSSPLVGGSSKATTITSKLSPLLAWLEQSALCCKLHPLSLPQRRSGRWVVVFVAVALFSTILLSYISAHSNTRPAGWLATLWAGTGSAQRVCRLACPNVRPGDPDWAPRAHPINHACAMSPKIPAPCSASRTPSELLSLPPTQFLDNFHNPCWYEPFPSADLNPYRHNLYLCFSHVAKKFFKVMTEHWGVRRKTERNPQRLRCLPYAYIAGMPKSGSTDLYRKVTAHPDVATPPMKEPHWWVRLRSGARLNFSSAVPLQDYVDLFDNASMEIERRSNSYGDVSLRHSDNMSKNSDEVKADYHQMITVDASASTFWDNDNWWREPENCGRTEPLFTTAHYIRRLTPQAKIIVILRSPVERLFSDYLYFTKAKKSLAEFHEFVNATIQRMNDCTAQRSLRSCVYDHHIASGKARVRLRVGLYHVYLEEWLRVFPRNQLLVLRTEDYSKDVIKAVRQIYKFLKLRPLTQKEERRLTKMPIANTRKAKDKKLGTMLIKTRQLLQDFYRPHNQRLAEILRDDRFLWNDVTVTPKSVGTGAPEDGDRTTELYGASSSPSSASSVTASTASAAAVSSASDGAVMKGAKLIQFSGRQGDDDVDRDGGGVGGSDMNRPDDDGGGGGNDATLKIDVTHPRDGGDVKRTRGGEGGVAAYSDVSQNRVRAETGQAGRDDEEYNEANEYEEKDSRNGYNYDEDDDDDYDDGDYGEDEP